MYGVIFFLNAHSEITLLYMDDSDEGHDSRSSKANIYLNFS